MAACVCGYIQIRCAVVESEDMTFRTGRDIRVTEGKNRRGSRAVGAPSSVLRSDGGHRCLRLFGRILSLSLSLSLELVSRDRVLALSKLILTDKRSAYVRIAQRHVIRTVGGQINV